MLEMVGPEHLRNAVSLNSVLVNVARMIGPAVAGLLIASAGEGWCFLLNAVSFVAVIASLLRLDTAQISRARPAPASPDSCARAFATCARPPSWRCRW